MLKEPELKNIGDIEFKVVYSRRRTLGISVLPDASVVVRVPFRTSGKTIAGMVEEKSDWIRKYRDYFLHHKKIIPVKSFTNGSIHFYRGNNLVLNIQQSSKPFVKFNGSSIELGMEKTDDEVSVSRLLKKAYKNEAQSLLPYMFNNILEKYKDSNFSPTGLVIRSMKRRWGSCSNRGKITLSSELIKLNDIYIEYVMVHELCHLKHHNHGPEYYDLLSGMFPDWKRIRKEMKMFIM